jgi:EAL domain-containing protein (putative c-di-GMP-specific phosphodiesterase class I)
MTASGSGHSDDDTVRRVLELARSFLKMEIAWLSQLHGDQQVFTHVDTADPTRRPQPGSVRELANSYCRDVLAGRLPRIIPDSTADPVARDLPTTREFAIGAYVGVPVRAADGTPKGMLCCASRSPQPHLKDVDLRLLDLLAGILAELDVADARAAALESVRQRTTGAISGHGRTLVLQPIVDVLTGVADGVEALARFDSPQPPDQWFAQAEPVGLRLPLELAAARSALEALDRPGHAGYLSLNLSAEAILSEDFAALVAATDPRRLVIEITEHQAVEDYDALTRALCRPRSAGVRLAVDDAGAGYASFKHILALRPDFIKIDLSLVRDIHLDEVRQVLVALLVTFAGSVDAVLVAEGVEQQAELDTLVELGVRYMQGFFLCPPCADPPSNGFQRPSRHLLLDLGRYLHDGPSLDGPSLDGHSREGHSMTLTTTA